MFNPLDPILQTRPVILDGAMATELEARGADLHDALWSAKILMEQPTLIRDVHLDYFRAGADCAITASYQATIEGFRARGLAQADALTLIKKSVSLAQEARGIYWAEANPREQTQFIAGSVGPYGAFLADGSEYRGGYGLSEAQLIDFHGPRIAALVEAGVDILACETIPTLIEARALITLLAEFPQTPAWISFSARDETTINHGESMVECARVCDASPNVVAVGLNCTPPNVIPALIREARKGTQKPILVYPNSGEMWDAQTNSWYGETHSETYGAQAKEWYEAGARIIGGCCRTTPEHIQSVREVLKNN
jgi:homocysteine S-methyltransferase